LKHRMRAIKLIDEAVNNSARRKKACEMLDITIRTYWRWKKGPSGDRRKGADKRVARKLTDQERKAIIDQCCSSQNKDKTPYEVYFSLLEEDSLYIASISSFYRVLGAANKLHHRGNCKPRKKHSQPPEVIATGPNQVWCWDITWLATEVKGLYLYAYTIIDIWDKSIVGWDIHDREDAELARDLFQRMKSKFNLHGIHLHSDNGNPMKGMTLLAFLYSMKVSVSRSRPRVSNDNPFIESFFKTMKYSVCYPGRFKGLEHARSWMADFINWYNNNHRHSGINYVTPAQMRSGMHHEIFTARNEVIQAAYEKHPERWSKKPKQWGHESHTVYLNPSAETKQSIREKEVVA
jgi:putative transposase